MEEKKEPKTAEKKIDYFGLISDSLSFTWKYKILWIFGFLIAMFSGGSSSGNSNFDTSDFDRQDTEETQEVVNQVSTYSDSPTEALDSLEDYWGDFTESVYFVPIILGLVLFVVIMAVIGWYLRTVSKTAIIKAVQFDQQEKYNMIKFKSLWKGAHPYLLRLLLFGLLMIAISIPLIIVLVAIMFLGVFAGFGNPLAIFGAFCCIALPLMLIVGGVINAVDLTARRLIILNEMEVMEAFKTAWSLVKENWKKYLYAWLTGFIPGIIFGIISFVVNLVLIIGLVLVIVGAVAVGDALSVVLGVLIGITGVCGFVLFASAIRAPYEVFANTYWTKFLFAMK